jgi:hypothetical protein
LVVTVGFILCVFATILVIKLLCESREREMAEELEISEVEDECDDEDVECDEDATGETSTSADAKEKRNNFQCKKHPTTDHALAEVRLFKFIFPP